ncbi:response regulator [Pantanalinema sp. GBBB05]|uniref:response regulator n=1 Tax=Pantanalinema sp. GBBB05 TaxID=2604139 RepID=UPI001D311F58|nr:response regulator [Pantanalinema sp. GBBB05]
MAQRILVVDDEDRIREIVRACLEDLGDWTVDTAASGSEGILKAISEPFDAILLDVSMPDMDGVTFFERLQTNPKTQAIPVILLTAKVLPADKAQFAELGVAGVISKPFDPIALSDEVGQILHRVA